MFGREIVWRKRGKGQNCRGLHGVVSAGMFIMLFFFILNLCFVRVCVCVCVTQLCPTIWDPMDYSLPDSSVHGILQARILEWVAIPFCRGSSQPRDQTHISCIAGRYLQPPGKPYLMPAATAKSLQSCPTLCDPIDGSPPGFPVPGILQARTLEWVAISFSIAWKWKVKVKLLSRVQLFATPWTAAHQALPSLGFSRQECSSGVPLPSPI